jgi:hypothetical protein
MTVSWALSGSGLPKLALGGGSASNRLVDVALVGVDPFGPAGVMVDQLLMVKAKQIENG